MNIDEPTAANSVFRPVDADLATTSQDAIAAMRLGLSEMSGMRELTKTAQERQFASLSKAGSERARKSVAAMTQVADAFISGTNAPDLLSAWTEYLRDAGERSILFLDTMRERGDIFIAHEEAGCPPVLTYEYEVVVDGATLPRPCNYVLLRILPPAGVTIVADKRPYIIIDPRAGHGGGIGGFKDDSQVGVALKRGNPVYFVAFKRDTVPTQTLADVTRAEAHFVREVTRLHPDSPKPVVTGNCQGGWATLLLGAANPDLTGPLLINGAPVDAWAGEIGKNPMRYNGGMMGGAWLAMLASDIGDGVFDGANLVENFEKLNPSRNFFGKYYDLYAKVDTERERFLEFERWWGGFFMMNEAEITWIVDNIFIGNKLARNEARLEHGRVLDLKNIRAPIIVFTSHGDNITPPQQALDWIVDTYADADEIRIRGQRIIYLVHDTVGHLGIFVSASVANKEHTGVASTLRTIETLPPGLYEMVIESVSGEGDDKHFTVSFAARELSDIERIDDGRGDEVPFAAVARLSEIQADAYDVFARPMVQALTTRESAAALRGLHPLRVQRKLLTSATPGAEQLKTLAARVAEDRNPAAMDNPFVMAERLWSQMVQQSMDNVRDLRDAWYEIMFYSIYSTPMMRQFGRKHSYGRTLKTKEELSALPEVQRALMHVETGGFVEGAIRMLILLAEDNGAVRQDRLERASRLLTEDEPFRSLGSDRRTQIIHEQTMIVEFAREEAIAALPKLLSRTEQRELAARIMRYVPGPIEESSVGTNAMINRIQRLLGLPEPAADVTTDPLIANAGKAAE